MDVGVDKVVVPSTRRPAASSTREQSAVLVAPRISWVVLGKLRKRGDTEWAKRAVLVQFRLDFEHGCVAAVYAL